jgi:hypothetical protein
MTRIDGEILHQVGGLQTRLVAGRDHIADTDATIFKRLPHRHHDRTRLTGDRNRSGLHGDNTVIDVGKELFARA